MRIALFGGSFNPPHVAHQLACTYALGCGDFDELWMVPTYKHPFDKPLAPYDDRVAMCERAAALFGGRVKVSRIEEELGGESYTVRTVKALSALKPTAELTLVIGADLLAERHLWHGYEELSRLVRFFVLGRGGVRAELAAVHGIDLPQVSSTEVRAGIARGESFDEMVRYVPRAVLGYIYQRGLYR